MSTDKLIKDILAKYDEDFASNTWPVPGGKARAILHKCIERMSAKAGIWFDKPVMVCSEPDNVVLIVTGHMGHENGDREEWSFGEASPKNNKNAYPYSMAEKRGKDRVALKLIGLHGLLYSEEEADDFKQSDAPPVRAIKQEAAPDKGPEAIAATLKAALLKSTTDGDLTRWGAHHAETISGLPEAIRDDVRAAFTAHRVALRQQEAA